MCPCPYIMTILLLRSLRSKRSSERNKAIGAALTDVAPSPDIANSRLADIVIDASHEWDHPPKGPFPYWTVSTSAGKKCNLLRLGPRPRGGMGQWGLSLQYAFNRLSCRISHRRWRLGRRRWLSPSWQWWPRPLPRRRARVKMTKLRNTRSLEKTGRKYIFIFYSPYFMHT